ncbi:hypothetical protein [Agrobacterium pusense]|uniref:hypothetical protein n=1 Tax=Agrobacterium pusense TaxID=648995 RepID=UPI00088A63F1|nr:hypothetical protein [Agrobacterium pusense]OOO22689.1 hypothetical protein BTE56_04580 [Agrobacterium pusense]WKD45041.1 hypothetical protein M8C82_16695 [Agrobacterium pusense]SDE62375.1 hypothetical protein SAMN05421750_102572 [Agrobacterium pusense]
MPYVQRDVDGSIIGIYSIFQPSIAEEEISDDDPEVIAFLNPVTIAAYENAIQNVVDSTAREKQFRDGVTLASYTSSTKPNWASEAQAFVAWRDNVWSYAYGELAKVQAGQREQPTVEQFLTEITPIAWPVA